MGKKVIFIDKEFEKELVKNLPAFPPLGTDLNDLLYFITLNLLERKNIPESEYDKYISIKDIDDKETRI